MPNLALPGNPRYQPTDLIDVFGYDYLYRALAEVEIATLRTLADIGRITQEEIALLTPEVEAELLSITTTEVDGVEKTITKHDVRAWVRIAQGKVDACLRRWIHVPLTSYDAIDTARSLQFIRAHAVVNKLARDVIYGLAEQVRRYSTTPQIGRTHGQHALPITVGFWLATVLSRILFAVQAADAAAAGLVGKISGAVGAYNAQVCLGFTAIESARPFEDRVLDKLGLNPARISTQILPPEPLADYLFACVKLSAALGQLGRDCRHLMRSEIREIGEPFEQGQVGSSTMAQKRNPMTFENIEGTWLKTKAEFTKVFDTLISEHQRDLVGSAVARDFPTIVVNVVSQLATLLRRGKHDERPFIARITVDEESCRKNFEMPGDLILAEPIYIALQAAGYAGDAHELLNHHAVPLAQGENIPLLDAVQDGLERVDPEMAKEIFDRIPEEMQLRLMNPAAYTGAASRKAEEIAEAAMAYLSP